MKMYVRVRRIWTIPNFKTRTSIDKQPLNIKICSEIKPLMFYLNYMNMENQPHTLCIYLCYVYLLL